MGETIIAGKYRLVRPLGQGAMGSVWLAEHVSLKTPVAVKLISAQLAAIPEARGRFDREAKVAAKIRSAHVVQILDHGTTDDGAPYIAMECLTGESLRERLTARGALSPAETARIVSHVCRALTRAHEAGLVHRDLKPENLFLCPGEDGELVKVLDFGVAKATDLLASDGVDPTRTGRLLGTPYYMSPEQAQGLRSVDYRSDLWAVGVVAFECLTGTRAFKAPALGPLIAAIVGGRIPLPSQVAPALRLPTELDAWMQRALSRAPGDRFASAKELSESFMVAAGASDSLGVTGGLAPPSATALPDAAEEAAATLAFPQLGGTLLLPETPPSRASSAGAGGAARVATAPSPSDAWADEPPGAPPGVGRSPALLVGAIALILALGAGLVVALR